PACSCAPPAHPHSRLRMLQGPPLPHRIFSTSRLLALPTPSTLLRCRPLEQGPCRSLRVINCTHPHRRRHAFDFFPTHRAVAGRRTLPGSSFGVKGVFH